MNSITSKGVCRPGGLLIPNDRDSAGGGHMKSERQTAQRPHLARASQANRGLRGVGLLAAMTVAVIAAGFAAFDNQRPDADRQTAAWQTLDKLDLALYRAATADSARQLRVIVRTASGDVDDLVAATRASGGRVGERFAVIDAVTAEIASDDLLVLAEHPTVTSVSMDSVVDSAAKKGKGGGGNGGGGGDGEPPPPPEDPPVEPEGQNHVRNTLGLDDEPWGGAGVNVAIIDSGVEFLLEAPLSGHWDFRGGRNPRFTRYETAADPYGHGTHVAGLIANGGWWSDGLYRGTAPSVGSLFSLRVLDENGAGYTSDVIRAISWVLENQRRAKVDVINLSLGHPILEPADSDPLVQAVEAAVRAGIVVVVSAGNYGYDRETLKVGYAGISWPGNAPSAITVGALDTLMTDARVDDTVAGYSSRGPTWYDALAKPDIVAPGSSLVSTTGADSSILLENPQLEVEQTSISGTPYLKLSGTSMATAVTSGVVASMLGASRSTFGETTLSPNAVKAILQYSALPLPDHDALTQGAGGLNADGALALAASIDPTAAIEDWWLVSPVLETSDIGGEELAWSQPLFGATGSCGATTSTGTARLGTSASSGATALSGATGSSGGTTSMTAWCGATASSGVTASSGATRLTRLYGATSTTARQEPWGSSNERGAWRERHAPRCQEEGCPTVLPVGLLRGTSEASLIVQTHRAILVLSGEAARDAGRRWLAAGPGDDRVWERHEQQQPPQHPEAPDPRGRGGSRPDPGRSPHPISGRDAADQPVSDAAEQAGCASRAHWR